jgi:hypothetical protein
MEVQDDIEILRTRTIDHVVDQPPAGERKQRFLRAVHAAGEATGKNDGQDSSHLRLRRLKALDHTTLMWRGGGSICRTAVSIFGAANNDADPILFGVSIMIIYMRTAVANPGKIYEAVAWAKEAEGVVKSILGAPLMVGARVGGNSHELCWSRTFETMAEMEQAMGKLIAAPDYMALIKKAEHLFCPGMTHEQVWRGI